MTTTVARATAVSGERGRLESIRGECGVGIGSRTPVIGRACAFAAACLLFESRFEACLPPERRSPPMPIVPPKFCRGTDMPRRSPAVCALLAGAAALTALAACAPQAVPPAPQSAPPATAAPVGRVTPGAPGEDRFADSVLALMTLEEKVGQLNQLSGLADPTGPGGVEAGVAQIRNGEVGSLFNVIGADTTRKIQHLAVTESRTR